MRIKDEIVCFAHLRWCHNGWASNILIVVDTGYAGIHHSKYWRPIHYDTIEDGQNKQSHLLFSNTKTLFSKMLCIFSKLKYIWAKWQMGLIRIVLRNSSNSGWFQWMKGFWTYGHKCTRINISHVLIFQLKNHLIY